MKKGVIEMQVLKEANPEIKITTEKVVDPKEYFQKRTGLYVWGSFKENVLPKAEIVKVGTAYTLESFDLIEDTYDKQIEQSLGNKNVFSESDACAIVAHLIDQQPEGKEGVLLTNGYANLFYTPTCVISVYWYGGGWYVSGWGRGDDAWLEGYRVFSPQLTLEV
jgi:hypothetical protein